MLCLKVGMGWFPEQPGGLNRVVQALCHHLPQTGIDVAGILAGSARAGSESNERMVAFAPRSAPLPWRLLTARRALRALLERRQPDLIAAHFALYAWPALDLMARLPIVVHFHGPWSEEARFAGATRLGAQGMFMLERAVYRRARLVIVLSRAFGDLLETLHGVSWQRIRVVPGGVEVERFALDLPRAQARRRLGLPADRPLVLAVRRLQRRMGLEGLLTALDSVRRRIPESLLLIAGSGPLQPALAAQIEAHGLGRHVCLLGRVPDEDLPLLYRAADLSIVPSVALEGFGLACLESLAAGTPVLVTPVGGLPEAVADLEPDLILPGHRPEDVAGALSAALLGATRLPSADACRRYARGRFDWSSIATKVRTVYLEAIG